MAYTTIDDPTIYFNTVTYTGNGGSQSVQGVGFQPDLVWLKSRSLEQSHFWSDVIRGAGQVLISNNADAEQNFSANFTAFSSDGYTLANGTNGFNASSETYVSWNWLAGGSASSNSDGSVTSNVSANTTAGFSICSFTQASSGSFTFGHGLGVAPDMVIGKSRGNTSNWQVFHTFLGTGKFIQLNSTQAQQTVSNFWGTIDTSIVTVGSNQLEASQPSVYYCFTGKKGYSKFGSYTGNGNADGTFAFTGFKPAFVMVRDPNNAENWLMYDNKRPGFNVTNDHMMANSSTTETSSTANIMDLLSNGFKISSSNNGLNRSGTSFFYMAFAEAPFVNSKGVPCNAR